MSIAMMRNNPMTEQNPTSGDPQTPATPADVPPNQDPQGDPEGLGEGGKKALNAERAARAAAEKTAKELQAQIDAIEAAKLTDLEKAQKAAADAQADAEAARAESLRYRIQAKHGVSDEDAALFLTGTDEATLEAQAARLAARDAERSRTTTDPLLGQTPQTRVTDKREFLRSLTGRE